MWQNLIGTVHEILDSLNCVGHTPTFGTLDDSKQI